MKDYRTCTSCIGFDCPYNQHCGEVMEAEKQNQMLLLRFDMGLISKDEVLKNWKKV